LKIKASDFMSDLDKCIDSKPNNNIYARWIPVHLKDMAELRERHPEVARKFRKGSFTVRKIKKIFSSIPIYLAHEHNNACIKGDCGAVGLTDNLAAFRRWMIAGPEVTTGEGHRGVSRWKPALLRQDNMRLDA